MNDLLLAGFNVRVKLKIQVPYFADFDGYTIKGNYPVVEFELSKEDFEHEESVADQKYSRRQLLTTAFLRKFSEWIPLHNAILLHSVVIDVDGDGVAFAAVSGTGKSTHMTLWKNLLGDRMTVVNGDKPIVRFFDEKTAGEADDNPEKNHTDSTIPGIPYAYGTPWMGKEGLGCNMRTPLRHICFIERSETNYVEEINSSDAIARIFNQVYMPADPAARIATVPLIDRLLHSCKLWIIHCNMEPEAAEVAYKTIFNK